MDLLNSYLVGIDGFLIGLGAFFVIGLFHPLVIKLEYHFGRKIWWALLFPALLFALASLFVNDILSIIFGVLSAGFFWSTLEIQWQHKRALKGQCKRNPNRKYE